MPRKLFTSENAREMQLRGAAAKKTYNKERRKLEKAGAYFIKVLTEMSVEEVKALLNDPTTPSIIAVKCRHLLSKRGYEVVQSEEDRFLGKARMSVEPLDVNMTTPVSHKPVTIKFVDAGDDGCHQDQ